MMKRIIVAIAKSASWTVLERDRNEWDQTETHGAVDENGMLTNYQYIYKWSLPYPSYIVATVYFLDTFYKLSSMSRLFLLWLAVSLTTLVDEDSSRVIFWLIQKPSRGGYIVSLLALRYNVQSYNKTQDKVAMTLLSSINSNNIANILRKISEASVVFFAFPLYTVTHARYYRRAYKCIIRDLTCIYIESYNTHLIYTPIPVEGDTHNMITATFKMKIKKKRLDIRMLTFLSSSSWLIYPSNKSLLL